MSLKTVRVPASMEAPFVDAERHVSRYFRDRKDDPEHGTIEIFGERYILVRAASLSVDFYALVERIYGDARRGEANEFAQSILFDLAHAVGKSDARNFHTKMGLVDPIAKLSAGPIHFAHAGWAFVEHLPRVAAGARRVVLPGLRPPLLVRVRRLGPRGEAAGGARLHDERRLLVRLV